MNPTPSRLPAGSFLSLSWPGAVPVSTSGAAAAVCTNVRRVMRATADLRRGGCDPTRRRYHAGDGRQAGNPRLGRAAGGEENSGRTGFSGCSGGADSGKLDATSALCRSRSARGATGGLSARVGEARADKPPVAPRQVDPAPPECCRRPRRASLEFAMPRRSLPVALLLLAGAVAPGQAPDPSKLTIDRIFEGKDFQGDPVAPPKWLDAATYTTTEPSKKVKGGSDIVRYDAATGT